MTDEKQDYWVSLKGKINTGSRSLEDRLVAMFAVLQRVVCVNV